MRKNTRLWAALFVLMLSLCISNAALSEENTCAHESIEQIFVRAEQITSAVKVPNQGHMLYGSIVVYDQCFYCHEQLSNEYIVDSYQEGHAAGVDGTCIYCGYLVVDHNAIRLLYTESGFSVGGTSEFILTITNTTDYTVYGGCSAYYNDGTGSGTPVDMFSGDICYRSNLGTIQTETLTFQPGEQKKLSVNAKIPDTWLDTSYIAFSFSGTYADSNGESHICSVEVEFTHTDDTPPSPPIVWEPDVLSLDVAAKEFAVDGKAVFEVTFANKAEYPVDCWLSVFYWQGYGNAVYNNMFGGDVSQEKAEVFDGLGTDIHGYAGTDKIVLDPGQSETLNVTAEIPSTWSEKSSICFSIGGWYTPDGTDSHFVRTEYVFGNDDIPSVPDEPPAPDDQDKFELLEIADSHYKLQNANSGWYLNAFIDPNSLGTYSSYDGINQVFTLKKSVSIQEAYTFYCENIYKTGLTGIAASGTEMQCVDADHAGSFKLLKVNNPADPSGEYAAIAVTINDTYYAVTETNTMMGSARKVALEAYTPGNKAQMWKLTKAKGVDVITGDTPVSVNMQPATLQYALDGKSSNELTLSLKLVYPTDLIDIVPNTNGTLTIHAKKAGVAEVTVTTASGVSSDAFTVWSVPCMLSVPYIKLQPNMYHELSVISDDSAMQFEFSVEDTTIAAIEKGPNGKTVNITALGNNGTTNIIAKYVHDEIVYQMKCLVEYGMSDTDRKIGWEDWLEHWKTVYPDGKSPTGSYWSWNHAGTAHPLNPEVTDKCCPIHSVNVPVGEEPYKYIWKLWAEGTCNNSMNGYVTKIDTPQSQLFKTTQCNGFIDRLTYLSTGQYVSDENTNWWHIEKYNSSQISVDLFQVGDIISWKSYAPYMVDNIEYTDPPHWIIVTKVDVDNNRIGTLECNIANYGCMIYRGHRNIKGRMWSSPNVSTLDTSGTDPNCALATLQWHAQIRSGNSINVYRFTGELKSIPYSIISGNQAVYSSKSGTSLSMTSNGNYDKFIRALVDGKELDAKDCDVARGSTIITLKPEYLSTLEPGEHSLTFEFTTGSATGTFYIEASQIITVQPADQEVTEGQTATFAVEAEGESLSYQWYINRQDGKGWGAIDGANRNQFTTQAVTSEHDGYQYYCAVTGSDGAAYKSDVATLHVLKLQALPDTGDHSMIFPGLVSMMLAALSLMYIRRYRKT